MYDMCKCVCSLGVLQNVDKAQTKVRSKKDNVAGQRFSLYTFCGMIRLLKVSCLFCFRCYSSYV